MALSKSEIETLETSLGNWFHEAYGQVFRLDHFALPSDYQQFLMDDRLNKEAVKDFSWYQKDQSILDNTKFFMKPEKITLDYSNNTFYYHRPSRGKRKKGMWIPVAEWRDRDTLWLCCHADHRFFGKVRNTFDGHPWDHNSVTYSFDSFTACMEWWVEKFEVDA